MKKRECPSCAMQVDEKAAVCPVCGFEFPVRSRAQKLIYLLVLILFLLVILGRIFHVFG